MIGMLRTAVSLIQETVSNWLGDQAPRIAAAVAFYAAFALAPMLILVIRIAGLVFGESAVRGEVLATLTNLLGEAGGQAVASMLVRLHHEPAGPLATVLGAAALLFGASGVFFQLQWALNTIWNVRPQRKSALKSLLLPRLISLAMILGAGVLLLVLLSASTALAIIGEYFRDRMFGVSNLWQSVYLGFSFVLLGVIFGLLFKTLPDARVAWRDVALGASVTAVLFAVGQWALGLYLSHAAVRSTYGAAGSFVVILLWIYYSSQILFLGAEFTQVWARRRGRRIEPRDYATWIRDGGTGRAARSPDDEADAAEGRSSGD